MRLARYISVRAFVLSSNLIGLCGIVLFAYNTVTQEARLHSQLILRDLNLLIAQAIKQSEADFQGLAMPQDCAAFQQLASTNVYHSADIRSISWVKHGALVCSTLADYQNVQLDKREVDFPQNTVAYIEKTPFNRTSQVVEHGVVLISVPLDLNNYLNFGIHPRVVQHLLENFDRHFDCFLQIGDYLFSERQVSKLSAAPDLSSEAENQWFKVYYHYSVQTFLGYLFKTYGVLMLLWLMISSFTARHVYRAIAEFDWLTLSLAKAIKAREFVPYMQAIVDRQGQLASVEVLARWQSPSRGLVSPAHFVEVAEQSKQINMITKQLFEIVREGLPLQPKPGIGPVHVGFNIYPHQFIDPELMHQCQAFLQRFAKQQYVLVLEITERDELPSQPEYLQAINQFRAMGIKLALDDFGTGHCSLKYLHKLDVDFIKIDKSYVDAVELRNKIELLDNIIDLAQSLNVATIAEGVENHPTFDYLKDKGVHFYQGYLFQRPQPLHDFIHQYLL